MSADQRHEGRYTMRVFIIVAILVVDACNTNSAHHIGGSATMSEIRHSGISQTDAIRIAREDAMRVYRNLTGYDVRASLQSDGWHVDYEVVDKKVEGGGAHYVIDAQTGTIKARRYEQ